MIIQEKFLIALLILSNGYRISSRLDQSLHYHLSLILYAYLESKQFHHHFSIQSFAFEFCKLQIFLVLPFLLRIRAWGTFSRYFECCSQSFKCFSRRPRAICLRNKKLNFERAESQSKLQ